MESLLKRIYIIYSRLCWHKFKDIETQITKGICFGFAGAELPGMRIKRKCVKCGKIEYLNLNMMMPNKYLYEDSIWK